MARRKPAEPKKVLSHVEATSSGPTLDREDKIMNSIANVTVILMSTMMGAFSQVMTKTADAMTSGIAEAFGDKEAKAKVKEENKKNQPEIKEKMNQMIFDIKKDVYAQMEQKQKEMKPLLSNQTFDEGPKIIEKHDFKLPKLTQKLDDQTLTQYSELLTTENPEFIEMFKELTSWLNSLPKPPEQTNKTNHKSTRNTKIKKEKNKK